MNWRMPSETWDKRSQKIRVERDAIVRKAEERHIESLVLELAALLDRTWREEGGEEPVSEIREVQLRGEYPDTTLAIRRYEPASDVEVWSSYPIWGNVWERPDGTRYPPERLAAEILTWVFGV
jgi:hypothetical protein